MEIQTTTETIETKTEKLLINSDDYASLLKCLGIDYRPIDYHFKIGETKNTQGWILHLSVVLSQIDSLLKVAIPYLYNRNICFTFIMNLAVAEDILSGNLGSAHIGKIMSIYPKDDTEAVHLAKDLILLTQAFKGPTIPTDLLLGTIVYTRYGSINPVIKLNEKGAEEKYIYDTSGQLVPDLYNIPFQMPEKVSWPFSEITPPKLPEQPQLFNKIYKVLSVLKNDCRGSVFQGLYLKNLFSVKKCVLKQGFSNADSDILGRDIRDKLNWQVESYKDLSECINLPTLYDFIDEKAYSLLVMEYISGDSLYQKVQSLNPLCKAWQDLAFQDANLLISFAIEISQIVSRIHEKGYVHRDIMPVNFIVNKKGKLFVIDLELSYSFIKKRPNPPFKLGTPGFASPEQMQFQTPALDQDIYSLGAMLLWLFTGLTPIKFYTEGGSIPETNLNIFLESDKLTGLIKSCLSADPQKRPTLSEITSVLKIYQSEFHRLKKQRIKKTYSEYSNNNDILYTILAAVKGLTKTPVISAENIWYSKKISVESRQPIKQKQYARYPGLGEGISGSLYVLSRLEKVGVNIDFCKRQIEDNWKYIAVNHLTHISELSPGLYNGAAGIALAIKENISNLSWLTAETNLGEIFMDCFDLNTDRLSLADGVAGQGIALLRCRELLPDKFFETRISTTLNQIIKQEKTGTWQNSASLDIGQEDVGIIYFLLEYLSFFPDKNLQLTIENSLDQLLKNKTYNISFLNIIGSRESFELSDGGMGLILLLIKAYEVLKDMRYKSLAQKILRKFPTRIVHTNFTQKNGLSGLGEVYLEALKVLMDDEWNERANWIGTFFVHTLSRSEIESGHWIFEEHNPPTADLLTGVSGVIHFLARSLYPKIINYRLLT